MILEAIGEAIAGLPGRAGMIITVAFVALCGLILVIGLIFF